ncbi:MAG: hypothetical protein AB7L09_01805 [Nitrospira sp.]
MTDPKLEQLKGVWELAFIGWTIFIVALGADGNLTLSGGIAGLVVEWILLMGGYWIADTESGRR